MIPATFPTGTGSAIENISWTAEVPATTYDRAVVIAYGSDGLTPEWKPEIERHAKALANAGVLALIPDYFELDPPTPHGSSAAVFSQILPRHQQWEQVLRDAVTAAKALPGIDDSKVGFIGFSLGGFLGLRIRDSVNVLIEYFSPYRFPPNVDLGELTPLKGLGGSANPSLKVMIHHGKSDRLVPINLNATPIKADLLAEGASAVTIYHTGANHGFQGPDSDNKTARQESLKESVKFIQDNL
ncbi:dienelactone hydrolase family protein [Planctomycetes bacterium TBK1r]|uniref:Dienelactone hydrolase family protein n=1 Tax=Stieleria magnilauensis TaxID=2527963 RepID=A0ABX5XIZ5_9BACT|nr:Dienelactone hydrolase family protein [Planctomycetes bacterium TBK1r]